MHISIWFNEWLNIKTFWQMNVAFGLAVIPLFVFYKTAPHDDVYRLQVTFSHLAEKLVLGSTFAGVGLVLVLATMVLFLGLRYGNLANKLKMSAVSIYAILATNVCVGLYLSYNLAVSSLSTLQPLSTLGLGGFLHMMTLSCLFISAISIISCLFWHYIAKPNPKLQGIVLSLLKPQPSTNTYEEPRSKFGKNFAIAVLVGLLMIGINLYRIEITKHNRIENTLLSNMSILNEKFIKPNNDPLYYQKLHKLGEVLVEERRYLEAEHIFRSALNMADATNTLDGRVKTTALIDLAELLRLTGNTDEAMILYQRIFIMHKST